MIFKQLFDEESSTYTYLIADEMSGKAVLIDTVKEHTAEYIELLNSLDLKLKYVLDTHTHADHISANGELRDLTGCTTLLGEQSASVCIDRGIADQEVISIGDIELQMLHTPGHTSDSYSFHMEIEGQHYLFTGDTLLINGSGRTDFQNGSAHQQYDSIFNKLLVYPEDTLIYPGHDYNGETQSTVGKEKRENPRLQVSSESEYVEIMHNLKLPNPKLMDIAVPANERCGSS